MEDRDYGVITRYIPLFIDGWRDIWRDVPARKGVNGHIEGARD